MSYLELLKLAAPEAIVVLTALIVLGVGLAAERGKTSGAGGAASLFVALTGLAAAISAIVLAPQTGIHLNGMLVATPLSAVFKTVCLVLTGFTVLLSAGDKGLRHRAEYVAMLLFAAFGLMLLVGSEELLVIFIGLELLGLSLYVLTAWDKAEMRGAEAALKYFLFGSTASAFTLFGISLVYGATRSTALAAIAETFSAGDLTPLLATGVVMTLIGFAFKIAAAPFHLWAPDTYQAAPPVSAAFIASASKVASFVVLGKILLTGFAEMKGSADWGGFVAGWAPMLAVLAASSIVIGNLVALVQKNVRRLLAYSAVAHAGYTLLGLLAGAPEGFSATLFYTTIYAVTLLGAFGVVAIVRRLTGGDDIAHFAGLARRSPLLAGCTTIFMLSLAGLPPLAGFFGKFYLFAAAMRAGGNHGLLWLVVLALVGSLGSLYYYLVVLKVIFLDRPSDSTAPTPRFEGGQIARWATAALAALVVIVGLLPDPLVARIVAALS